MYPYNVPVAPPPTPYLKFNLVLKKVHRFFLETARYKDLRRSCHPVLARTTRPFLARVNATLIRRRSLRNFLQEPARSGRLPSQSSQLKKVR